MTKPRSGIAEAENAEWLYEHREELETGEPVDIEVSPNLASVVSVRFKRGELSQIEAAATAAGMPFTTYIREAALAASGMTDINRVRRDAKKLHKITDDMLTALGEKAAA
ncbi:MAG: hypothetical protein DLM55_02130 [Acidimicrobiales bacterium]|nr:MAG: hypothetical protein DLM55_02130 [Acidimicrobiales bacterium]